MTIVTRIAAVGMTWALVACNTLPTYTPAPGEKTVSARFVGFARPSICVEGKSYHLNLTENKGQQVALLPADKRVLIFAYQQYAGYQITSSCHASLSVTPKVGKPLVINSGLDAGKCFVEAVVEDPTTPSGLALDLTVGPPRC